VSSEALPGRWRQYFPDLDADEAVRGFATDENWRNYGEPLSAFMHAATVLEWALREVESAQALRLTNRRTMPDKQYHDYEHGVATIDRLASVVTPVTHIDEHLAPRPRWSSPSLLGSLARMALLDLWGGSNVLCCANCGAVFISKAPKARFCTSRCRDTYHKRAWRDRSKAGEVNR
jgi:hypothetical protein